MYHYAFFVSLTSLYCCRKYVSLILLSLLCCYFIINCSYVSTYVINIFVNRRRMHSAFEKDNVETSKKKKNGLDFFHFD